MRPLVVAHTTLRLLGRGGKRVEATGAPPNNSMSRKDLLGTVGQTIKCLCLF